MIGLSRRRVLVMAGAATVGSRVARAQAPAPSGPFTLPPLPYAYEANEPSIDAETMRLHHDRHHAAYVASLNAALKDQGQAASLALPDLLAKLGDLPEQIRAAVRNNGGGHANHSMFWTLMGGKGGSPSGELAAAIDRDFGSFADLQTRFNDAGMRVFGSGWVMVTVKDGKLALATRPNQDSPLMDGGRALFGNDVWEHAYYLKYQNRRADYLKAWWNVVDWTRVGERYGQAKAGTLQI